MKNFILVVLLTLIFGCSENSENYSIEEKNGVKLHKNSIISSLSKQELDKLYEIKGRDSQRSDSTSYFYNPLSADTDKEGNIFIADVHRVSVLKFDKQGNFIKSFGKLGNGPGEIGGIGGMAVSSEKVYIVDYMKYAIVTFDIDGNYIEDIPLENGFPMHLKKVGDDKFIGIKDHRYQKDGQYYMAYNLTLMDNRFKDINVIAKIEYGNDPNKPYSILDGLIPYAVSEDRIYISSNSEDHYLIDVYNFEGEKTDQIKRSYRKLPMSEKESLTFDDLMTKKNQGQKSRPLNVKHKKAVNNIYYDKGGYLVVLASIDRNESNEYSFIADIYKDNILINKLNLTNLKGYDFFFLDDRYYFRDDNLLHLKVSEALLNVYDLKSINFEK